MTQVEKTEVDTTNISLSRRGKPSTIDPPTIYRVPNYSRTRFNMDSTQVRLVQDVAATFLPDHQPEPSSIDGVKK